MAQLIVGYPINRLNQESSQPLANEVTIRTHSQELGIILPEYRKNISQMQILNTKFQILRELTNNYINLHFPSITQPLRDPDNKLVHSQWQFSQDFTYIFNEFSETENKCKSRPHSARMEFSRWIFKPLSPSSEQICCFRQ